MFLVFLRHKHEWFEFLESDICEEDMFEFYVARNL